MRRSKIWISLGCILAALLAAVPLLDAASPGVMIQESDGAPAGFAWKVIVPNDALSLSNSVGTLTFDATDNRISTLTTSKWCYSSDGATIECTQDTPAGAGTVTVTLPVTDAHLAIFDGDNATIIKDGGGTISAYGLTLIDDGNATAARATLGLVIGTNVLAPNGDGTSLTGVVLKGTYDAHTVLYATTDNTPAALTVTEQTIVGRATGGNIAALAIDSDLAAVSANDDTVPSAKATKAVTDTLVTKALYDAYSVLYADSDNTPAALTVGANTLVGRGAAGGIAAITLGSGLSMGGAAALTLDASLSTIGGLTETRGDLMYVGAAGTWADLAVGAANTVLTTNGTDPAWGTVTSAMITDNTITATDLAAALTFADQDLLDLSAITMSGTNDEGLALPIWGNVTPTTPKAYLTATSGGDLKVYSIDTTSWKTFAATAAPIDSPYLLIGANDGTLTADRRLVAGVGISETDAGANGAYTLAFDPAEVTGNRTWGDGSDASIVWTVNLSGTDDTITFGSGSVGIGGTLALGANNLTMTGSLAATANRVTKGWFTDIESTNIPTVGGTAILSSITAPVFTTSIEAPFIVLGSAATAADAGAIRLPNAAYIMAEADAASTDISVIGVDSSEIIQIGASGATSVTITPATTITGAITSSGGITVADSQAITFDESAVDPNDADVVISATDGVITFAATNGANNENLTIDLDAASNVVTLASGSGAAFTITPALTLSGHPTIEGVTATGATGTGKFVFDTSPAITTAITPAVAGASTLGTTALEWGNVYLGDSAVIYGQVNQGNSLTSSATGWTANLNLSAAAFIPTSAANAAGEFGYASNAFSWFGGATSEDLTLTFGSNLATFASGTSATVAFTPSVALNGGATVTTALTPVSANGATLGTAALEFADLYLADGGVIYFQNDQSVYLTPSAGTLTLTGALVTSGAITPSVANGAALGSATAEWADLFLSDGGVIYGQADQSATLTSSASTWTASAFTSTGTLTANGNTVLGDADTDTLTIRDLIVGGNSRAVWIAGSAPTPTYATGTNELYVAGDIETAGTLYATTINTGTGTDGTRGITLTSNTSFTCAGDQLYFLNDVLYACEGGTGRTVVTSNKSVTWTSTSQSFAGVTNLLLPTAAPDAAGEIGGWTAAAWAAAHGTYKLYDGTAETYLVAVQAADTPNNAEVLTWNTGGTITWESAPAGLLSGLGDPSGDTEIVFGAGEEVVWSYTGNFTTGSQFQIIQQTGNPSGGVLFEVFATDTDITAARLGDGTNYTQFGPNGSVTFAGTATFTAASATSSVPWKVGTGTASNTAEGTAYWESDTEILTIGDGTTGVSLDFTANTAIVFPSAGGTLQTTTGTPAGFVIASQAQGDVLYASSATAWARLGAATAGNPLISGGAAANPSFLSVVLAGGTNTFSVTNGTASLDVAAGAALNIDTSLQTTTGTIVLAGNAAGSSVTLPASGTLAILGANTFTALQTIDATAGIQVGSTGVLITSDNDGAIKFLGASAGSDESLIINLDDTDNTAVVSTDSGVTKIDFSALNLATTGTIQGGIVVSSDADGMDAAAMTAAGLYGTLFIATGAGTWILPDVAAAGQSGCLMDSGTAHDLILDVTAGSTINLSGTEQADGVGITNASGSSTGDFICFVSTAAHKWSTMGKQGTWASQ